jgi:general secretion pathway protein E
VNAPADLQALVTPFDAGQLRTALREAAARGLSLSRLLEAQGEPVQTLAMRLAHSAALPCLDRHALEALTPAFDALPYTEAVQRECLFMREADGQGVLVVADPFDADLQAWAQERVRRPMALKVAARGDIEAYLARHEDNLRAMDGLASEAASDDEGARAEDISLRSISEDSSPVVRLVNSTLYDALKAGASDIHLETGPGGIAIKYRIDGVLASVGHIAGSDTADQVISRIKVMAELDIAERRVPQDGRFKVAARGRRIDIRVSIMPSIHGEDAVLRVLDKERLADEVNGLTLDALGFDETTKAVLRRLCGEPYGMVLVTGPTGSGKTTTLYGAINEIHTGHDKIVTIEDPVEYQLGGVLQIPVNEKKGLTFARGLRSILRHDPDKIMVGEIRDAETAQIAVQAALTGHLVLTTVHANNVFDVLGRFTHMGLDPYSLMAALNGIVAQRLLRVLCNDCAQPDPTVTDQAGEGQWRRACGCASCRGTGYRGRKAVAEVLVLDDELREAIVQREPVRRIKELAFAKGTRELREAATALARRGETTLQEVLRVVR